MIYFRDYFRAKFPGDSNFIRLASEVAKMGEQECQSIIDKYPFPSAPKLAKTNLLQSDDDLLFSNTSEASIISEFKHSKSNMQGDEFWAVHSTAFPQLFNLYKKLSSIQLTNASVERLFSQANLVYDNLSGSMDPETVFAKLTLKTSSKN